MKNMIETKRIGETTREFAKRISLKNNEEKVCICGKLDPMSRGITRILMGDDTKLMKESKMDIVNLSNKERRLESKMTVGPTIFERLRDLQKFDQKERVRRLECHRMVRYREEIKSLMDDGTQQVNLNDMFDDLYTNFRERKNNATNDDAATNAATDSTNDNNDITSDWAEASERPR